MTHDFDILIVGGGMVGACAAALLAQEPSLADARIVLLEAQPPMLPPADTDVDIRVSAISRASERILSHAEAWPHIPVQHFSADETSEPNLGYIIENRRLQWALFAADPFRKRVTVLKAQLTHLEFEDDSVRVTLADDRKLGVRMVLAADGAGSPSRKLANIEVAGWKYDQFAVVTHVETEQSHQHTAWQRFTATGPVAFLPLADGRSSIVWTTTPDHSERLVAATAEDFARELGTASDHVLGGIRVTAPRARFPLQLAHARTYTRPRFALLGDAAHAVHPLAGQGVNLGFMDCAALVETLAAGRQSGASLDALCEARVLRRYERWRKSENVLALGMIDGINRLFSNDSNVLGALRRAGFAAIERTPHAKRFFIMRALGLAGERPKMTRAS
jgi:2-octaprenylphenol hydroxylase